MHLIKHKYLILAVGIIIAIIGIILTNNFSIGQTLIIFGCYWSGMGAAFVYVDSQQVK